MAERVNLNVQWVTDDNNVVTGYEVRPGDRRPIGGGGGALAVQNDAAQVVSAAASIDFQGALRASGSGGAAAVMIDQANVLQTPTPDGIPAYTGFSAFRAAKQRAIGLGGYPRRRNLMSWTDASSVNFRLVSGSCNVANDYTDPNFGEPYNASNAAAGGAATNGKAIKLTWGANGVFLIGDKVTLPAAVDVTGKNVYVTFKVLSGDISLLDLNVRLISNTVVDSGVTEANYHVGKCLQPYTAQIKAGVWQTMGIPIEAFSATGSGATLTAITHIYLHINAVAAGSLLIGDVFVCPRVLSRGVAIIGFDDCRSDTWMHAARYLRKYGMPGVLYPGAVGAVMRASVDQYQMTPAQLSHLQKRYGWQVASQAWSTENPDVVKPTQTLAQFAGELSAMDAFYVDQGWEGGADGSFFSSVNKGGARDPIFEKAFRTMRTFTIWSAGSAPSAHPECVPLPDPMNLRAWGMDTSIHTVALTSAFVDKAIAQKGVARFVFHATDVSTANFTGLIDYIAQKQNEGVLDVMTEDQLIFTARARAFD